MNKQQDISPLTPKTAHDIAFTVHKHHYYDCREVDDVLDALLALIDRQEQEKQDIDSRLREYEANIAGIMLECQKLKASAQKEQEEKSGDISEETDGEACVLCRKRRGNLPQKYPRRKTKKQPKNKRYYGIYNAYETLNKSR